ncbi:MAG TPA: phosphatidylserine decarboxylase, partial [Steroidobacteraceae bacterium]|nr:phosphatidylserine decarboxylase [Steroidobacteraceae bacterium]
RVICEFDTALGRMAVILVGALFVGSMETVYAGEINPPPRRRKQAIPISKGLGQNLTKGAELGRFNMGSTVVLLFEKQRMRWEGFLQPQVTVQMGNAIGSAIV